MKLHNWYWQTIDNALLISAQIQTAQDHLPDHVGHFHLNI